MDRSVHSKHIDSAEALLDVLEYILANPIKAGFVDISPRSEGPPSESSLEALASNIH